ncbi:ATP-binding cassette domain-containing protein [Neomoorella thermoacetica]|uniref:ATP-binding cassette domain-containing protein n=1 Tax=Neomoorella thermoacetica TaxID=1525 RepID=UPI000908426E|nr:ABC transporter ATP-binding protein [Moorella thermoacetica]APC09530.1 putative ABC transporter ATP-binding protein YbhF [Moorella thermoacetica]
METIVAVKDLTQKIGKKTVLDGLSLEVSTGECLGIFGMEGSGKTALLHIIAGIDRFTSGKVEVAGVDVRKNEGFKKYLGLVTQERSLFHDLSAAENLDFIATLKNAGRENIDRLIERLELGEVLNQPAGSLEAGLYQRLALACALLNNPRLLIADELIGAIDLDSRRIILRELETFLAGGGTCIWAFSNAEFLPHTGRVGWLEKGKIAFYQPDEALAQWNARLQSLAGQGGDGDA